MLSWRRQAVARMSVNEGFLPKADKAFEVLDGASEASRTYVFGDEDHTLGNVLRHVLMQRSTACASCQQPLAAQEACSHIGWRARRAVWLCVRRALFRRSLAF